MTQITTGIRSILSYPKVYDTFQKIMEPSGGAQSFFDKHINAKDNEYVLDIGCGTANVLNYLPKSIKYYGFDISENYINDAREAFGAIASFECGYVSLEKLINLPKFDLVILIGVLHHLSDSEVLNTLNIAKHAMKENGRLITIDPCYIKKQDLIAKLLVSMDRGKNVRYTNHYSELANSIFSNVTGSLNNEKFIPYTRWIMVCTK